MGGYTRTHMYLGRRIVSLSVLRQNKSYVMLYIEVELVPELYFVAPVWKLLFALVKLLVRFHLGGRVSA